MDKEEKKLENFMSMGMVIGMFAGTAIGSIVGIATNNFGLYQSMGFVVGMCIGLVVGILCQNKNKEGDETDAEKEK